MCRRLWLVNRWRRNSRRVLWYFDKYIKKNNNPTFRHEITQSVVCITFILVAVVTRLIILIIEKHNHENNQSQKLKWIRLWIDLKMKQLKCIPFDLNMLSICQRWNAKSLVMCMRMKYTCVCVFVCVCLRLGWWGNVTQYQILNVYFWIQSTGFYSMWDLAWNLPFTESRGDFGEEARSTRMRWITGGATSSRIFQGRVVSWPCLSCGGIETQTKFTLNPSIKLRPGITMLCSAAVVTVVCWLVCVCV